MVADRAQITHEFVCIRDATLSAHIGALTG
jgi:hypothetical protein